MLNYQQLVMCVYCGNYDNLQHFLLRYVDGRINNKMCKCSDCGSRMRMKTLLADMSFYEFGLWMYLNIRVYNSPHNRFFEKIKWKKLNKNLSMFGTQYKQDFYEGFRFGKKLYSGGANYTQLSNLLFRMNDKFGIVGEDKVKQTKLV